MRKRPTTTTIRKYAGTVLTAWRALALFRTVRDSGGFVRDRFDNSFAEWRLSVLKNAFTNQKQK